MIIAGSRLYNFKLTSPTLIARCTAAADLLCWKLSKHRQKDTAFCWKAESKKEKNVFFSAAATVSLAMAHPYWNLPPFLAHSECLRCPRLPIIIRFLTLSLSGFFLLRPPHFPPHRKRCNGTSVTSPTWVRSTSLPGDRETIFLAPKMISPAAWRLQFSPGNNSHVVFN